MNYTKTVAIIDDDESMQRALVALMQSLGHSARSFSSAEAFIEGGQIEIFDCIITDLQMPGMSGVELMARLNRERYNVPIVAITAQKQPGLEGRVLAAGAKSLVYKPFDADTLVDCVTRALHF
jgi:FixJ family two-component response regulator